MASRLLSQSRLDRTRRIMHRPLRILHLEDDPDFSQLVRSLLEKEGLAFELVLVSNQADFEAAVAEHKADVILADYMLPAYNGIQALRAVRARDGETPF